MIFYEIELKTIPKIIFACSVEVENYHNSFHFRENFLELSIVEKGEIIYEYSNGKKVIVSPGTFNPVLIDCDYDTCAYQNQTQAHSTVGVNVEYSLKRCDSEQSIDIAALHKRIKEDRAILVPFCVPAEDRYSLILSKIKRIASLYNSPRNCDSIKAISAWFSLCETITAFTLDKLNTYNKLHSPATMRYVGKAKEYIHVHYKEDITVSDIAAKLGISVGYLHNIFKASAGMGLLEYLNMYRVELAKQLIVSRGLSLNEISEQVGINDPSYMSRLFKKKCGISYREFCRNTTMR